jgi:hypothetical protein
MDDFCNNIFFIPLSFTPLESPIAHSGDGGSSFFEQTRRLVPRVSLLLESRKLSNGVKRQLLLDRVSNYIVT